MRGIALYSIKLTLTVDKDLLYCLLFRMEDDIIAGLGNIRLTTDEEEIIAISETGRLEAIGSCCLSLMCKPFNKRADRKSVV